MYPAFNICRGDIVEQKEAPYGVPKDPELQQIMETLDVTHGKSDKIGSCRGAEIRRVRFIGQSLILVTLS